MEVKELIGKVFRKKEPEQYVPQREKIDRVHDALLRQKSFYEKKNEIPRLKEEIKALEKDTYGDMMHTKDENNIMKVPNHFKRENAFDEAELVAARLQGQEPRARPQQSAPPMTKAERFRRFVEARKEQLRQGGQAVDSRLRQLDQAKMARIRSMRRGARAPQRMQRQSYPRPQPAGYEGDGILLHARNAFAIQQNSMLEGSRSSNVLQPGQGEILGTPNYFRSSPYDMIQSQNQRSPMAQPQARARANSRRQGTRKYKPAPDMGWL